MFLYLGCCRECFRLAWGGMCSSCLKGQFKCSHMRAHTSVFRVIRFFSFVWCSTKGERSDKAIESPSLPFPRLVLVLAALTTSLTVTGVFEFLGVWSFYLKQFFCAFLLGARPCSVAPLVWGALCLLLSGRLALGVAPRGSACRCRVVAPSSGQAGFLVLGCRHLLAQAFALLYLGTSRRQKQSGCSQKTHYKSAQLCS